MNTDNFLPRGRDKSSYVRRPSVYTPRRPLINDFLPSAKVPLPPPTPAPIVPTPMVPAPPAPAALLTTRPLPQAPAPPKRRPQLARHLIIAVALLGAAAGTTVFIGSRQPAKHAKAAPIVSAVTPAKQAKQAAAVSWPVRLQIPRIGVDAPLDYVGVTPKGALDAPHTPTDAGWYNKGPRPGEKGSAVIDGHFGWQGNIPAVFDNLHTLQKGDNLVVKDDKGATITFIVRDVQTYEESQASSAVFIANDSKAHLNLITCDGAWSEAQKSYANRLIVFTDKVGN